MKMKQRRMSQLIQRLACIAALAIGGAAFAGPIVQDTGGSNIQIQFFEPIGQSFIAEDSAVKFALYVDPVNPTAPLSDLHFQLLSGDGLGGGVLLDQTLSPALGFIGYLEFDLSTVALTLGNAYTVAVDVPGTSPYWGANLNAGGNPYAGGQAYYTPVRFLPSPAISDFRFQVLPTVTAIPEPGTLAIASLALAGLVATRRRQSASSS